MKTVNADAPLRVQITLNGKQRFAFVTQYDPETLVCDLLAASTPEDIAGGASPIIVKPDVPFSVTPQEGCWQGA